MSSNNIPRVTQKIFAENAGNNIGQFGSALAGQGNPTGDIAEIQALPAWGQGWAGAVISERDYPPLEEMTGVQKVASQQIAYLLQKGIPEWDEGTTYFANISFCQINGIVYQSLTNNNIGNNPANDTTNWSVWKPLEGTYANIDLLNLSAPGLDKLNQSKALETGKVSSDADVYADIQKYAHSTFDKSKFEVVGSPVITEDGVASGFSSGNYLGNITINASSGNEFIFNIKYTHKHQSETQGLLAAHSTTVNVFMYCVVGSSDKVVSAINNLGYASSNTTLVDGQTYNIQYKTNFKDYYKVYINGTLEISRTIESQNVTIDFVSLGRTLATQYNTGTFDLKHFSITADGVPVFNGNKTGTDTFGEIEIPYTLSKTGSKIVDAAYRDRVQDVYEQYGTAMYYTIDEENRNFTLPMGEIYGMIEKKADFLNNPYSLLDVKWSDKLLNNISWLRSNGQSNSGNVYVDVYNLILSEYNDSSDEQETIGETSITFRRGSKTGIKVTTDKTSYDAILSETGTAWYYVLDTANKAFYLPQTNGFMQFGGTGEFVDAGLPNIEGSHGGLEGANFYTSGAFSIKDTTQRSGAGAGGGDCYVSFDASLSNPIYGNSETVQPNAIKGYLYFYVGETVQNANLINAGVLSEKANADLSNCTKPYVTETYVNGTSWYRLWSDGWCEQGGQTAALSAQTQTTIELLKEYSNTDYFINVNQPLRIGYLLPTVGIYQKNTANFIVQQSSTNDDAGAYATLWYACGF